MNEVLKNITELRVKQLAQFAITVLVLAALGLLVARRVMAPLGSVSEAIGGLSEGTLPDDLKAAKRSDEVGNIARGVMSLREVWRGRDESQKAADIRDSAMSQVDRALVMLDADNRIIDCNARFMELLSATSAGFDTKAHMEADSLKGTLVFDLLDDPSSLRALVKDHGNMPATEEIVLPHTRLSVRASVLRDQQGVESAILLEWEDVGEARLNNGLVSAIAENSATIQFDLKGNVISANENFLRVMGYSADEIVGMHHSRFVPEDERSSTDYATFWDRLGRGEQFTGKFRRVARDGREIWLEAAYNPIRDANGKPYMVVKYASDVTEIESLAFDRKAVLDAIGSAQSEISCDPTGQVISANALFLKSMSLSEDDVVGKPLQALMHKDYVASGDYQDMWSNLSAGAFDARIYQYAAADGSKRYFQGASTPVRDRDGKVSKIVSLIADVTASETERLAQQARAAESAAQQARVVEHMRKGLLALADGDLSQDITEPFGGEYEQLRLNFNRATQRLRETISVVVNNTDGIRNEASEIARSADDLSRRTENQAATLEQTSASLEQLTASVKSAAEGAEKANRNVTEAKTNAEASGGVVDEAINAMSAIEGSSRQISQIIGVIDDIAFQTNLLALNAGVEAARAGDAGRGFAVVASEVRALAQRSSEAAKEIKELISTSSEQVGSGVELVGRTGQALREILGSVISIADLVGDIANTAREQSVGIGEINSAVNQIDQVTQQNAAMVQESTAASHSLMQEAEQLASRVAQFKVGSAEVVTYPSGGDVAPPARAAKGPAVSGNTALQAEEVDDWKEL